MIYERPFHYEKPFHTVFVDGPEITPDADLIYTMRQLLERRGLLIWCNEGEYRVLGGAQLRTCIEAIDLLDKVTTNYSRAESHLRGCEVIDWNRLYPISSQVVRLLRDEAKQFSETDPTAESATE